jgi:alkyldihydroxyacetonephosphate synthase
MKWNGWGDPDHRVELGEGALELLRSELGAADPWPSASLEEVAIPAAARVPRAVLDAAGEEAVATDHETRVRHAAGRGYHDLAALRNGRLEAAPDAVLSPAEPEAVGRLLEACSSERVAVVPFGGGTSVVGGVEPLRGQCPAVISLDLSRLRAVELDRRSLTAVLGAGLGGPEAERELGARGVTLGHFPQSFEYATIGGFAATRSAGQASSGYGRFDELVTSLRMATPVGELRTPATPHSAAGPSVLQIALGSEGTLGVITEVTARVRPAPASSRYEAWMAADFGAGCELVRSLAQDDALPDIVRVSDREETRLSLAMAGEGLGSRALDAYLRLRRRSDGCILICGWEGEHEAVGRRRILAARLLRAGGAASLGRAPGDAWRRGRYEGPYLRDALLDAGFMVETLETAHTWSRLGELYAAVGRALRDSLAAAGTPGLVLCHLSHAYPDGASLYFTFLARRLPGRELEQWRTAKEAASAAIVGARGTITHHHAVGRDHVPYMRAEVGDVGLEALGALKERLDPAGIMNPGKLIPPLGL